MRILGMIIRWLLALGCLITFVLLMRHPEKSGFGDIATAMISTGLLVGSALLTAPETVTYVAEFIASVFAGLIFPNAKLQKAPLSYVLADFYSKAMRYEEAAREYKKIIRDYPDERAAYLGLISIYELTGESKLAKKYHKRFRRCFKIKNRSKKQRRRPRLF